MLGKQTVLSNTNLAVDGAMNNLIRSIVDCSYKDGLKKMFLLSKSIEFLVIQAEACEAATRPSYKYVKSPRDQESILDAREYVRNHLEQPPSLLELAKIVGINEYKLKRGFKEMFDNTVFGYLSEARLELGKRELADGNKSITEIASSLGYASVQHFSAAFKKKFGSAPTRMKK
jgi:AraC-like DNA-binding protein